MFNRFFQLLILCLIVFASHQKIYCQECNAIRYFPKQTKQAVKLIQHLPEAQELLTKIARDGGVGIEFEKSTNGFGAYWYGGRRVIALNPSSLGSIARQVNSILFEMHNAISTREMGHYMHLARQGAISRDEYVEAIERIEHRNALNTSKLLHIGIERGLFPREAWWTMPRNFNEYFRIQRRCGHSQYIAHMYDRMAPRRNPQRTKYLALKRDLESHDRERIAKATQRLAREMNRVEKDQEWMFHQIFSGNPVYEMLR